MTHFELGRTRFPTILSTIALCTFATAQNLRVSDLPSQAQAYVQKSTTSLSFVGFVSGGNEAIFSANDGLIRHVNLRTGELVRAIGGSSRRDSDLRNWASKLPLQPFTNRFQMYRLAVSPNGLYYSYTDATNVAWVVDTKTGNAVFSSQTGITNGGMWWSGSGKFFCMPMIFVLPNDPQKKESVFSLVEFDPQTSTARIARPWSVQEDNAPDAHKTPRKRWMNATWWYEMPGGSFSVSNNRTVAPIYGYFFSEVDTSNDQAVELPIAVLNRDDIVISPNSNIILVNDRKGKKVWLTKIGQDKPVVIADYSPVTAEGFDGSITQLRWVGTDKFLLTSVSAKRTAQKIERVISDWSLRALAEPAKVLADEAPKWASTTFSFSPDGKWAIDSMYIRKVETGKRWLVESNFAVHPSEATIKFTPVE